MVKKTRSKRLGCYFQETNVSNASFVKRIVWVGKNAIFSVWERVGELDGSSEEQTEK